MPTKAKPKRPQGKPWSAEEINILRTKYKTNTAQQLHKNYLPDRTPDAIYRRLQILGLAIPRKQVHPKPWSDEEKELLVTNYAAHDIIQLQQQFFPDRTVSSISNQLTRLGCRKTDRTASIHTTKKRTLTPWTPEETEILRKNFGSRSRKELCKLLPDKTIHQISHKATAMGLPGRDHTIWTPEENKIILENYATHSIKQLMDLLPNKTYDNIRGKLSSLRLKFKGRIRNTGTDRMTKTHWTDEELATLAQNGPKCTLPQLQELLPNRTSQAIRTQLIRTRTPFIKLAQGRKKHRET